MGGLFLSRSSTLRLKAMRSPLLVMLGLLLLDGSAGCKAAQEAPAPATGYHALLVGCTRYPSLGKFLQLEGPANDVALMRTLLTDRFKVPPESIVVLAEGAGGEDRRPTRANIEREFKRLEKIARPGERVVILLSGHGSYQPDQAPFDETDGLDELFLPCDISGWDRDGKRVTNAIVDDELAVWLGAIRAKGASVWLVMDSCHSGTMMRGNDVERPRRVRPEDLGAPLSDLAPARRPGDPGPERTRGGATETLPFDLPKDGAGILALYAARPEETAPELPLPDDSPEPKYHGLLTYTISKVLSEAKGPLSYRQLIRRIHDRYAALGRLSPTPMIEGNDQDRAVLGLERFDPAEVRLTREGDRWTIDAGALHGLTPGSILAVHEVTAEGNPGPLKGHARIIERGFRPIRARVEPCSYPDPGGSAPADLPDRGVCRLVSIDYGRLRLKVAADDKDGKERPLPEDDRRRLSESLAALSRAIADEDQDRKAKGFGPGKGALVEVVADPKQADWLLRIESPETRRIYLVPGAGVDLKADKGEPQPLFGPVPADAAAGTWLRDRLARIAAARNLLKIAGDPPGARLLADSDIKLEVELRRYEDEDDDKGQAVTPTNGVTTLREGEIVGVGLKNPGQEAVDVTLLLIDSGFGIQALFPLQAGTYNRLRHGDSTLRRFVVTAKTTGLEHLLVIAVKSRTQEDPADFSPLAQETIEKARAVEFRPRNGGPGALDTPLGRLLQAARFEGNRGGAAVTTIGDHRLQLLSWHTLARPQTTQKKP
jgi:hypothetical protein